LVGKWGGGVSGWSRAGEKVNQKANSIVTNRKRGRQRGKSKRARKKKIKGRSRTYLGGGFKAITAH